MTTMQELRLRVYQDDVVLPIRAPGEDCTVELRCLRGASGIHVAIADDTGVRLRAEIMAAASEMVPLHIEVDEEGVPHVWTEGWRLLLLDPAYEPVPAIAPAAADAPVDIAIVIDATLRCWPAENQTKPSGRLLDDPELRAAHADKLVAFVERIADRKEWRGAVLAFGDQDLPSVKADDLRPGYLLYPEAEQERVLQPLDPARLRERLLAIPSTSGGDFVDALADALAACEALRWRPDARKIVMLSGDSPGFSLLHPMSREADLCVRRLDVDTQVELLQKKGVEVVTIYHAPPAHLGLEAVELSRRLLRDVKEQYARLASVPELAFHASFDPESAAERLAGISGPIGRFATLGQLVRMTPAVRPAAAVAAGKSSTRRRSRR